MDLIELLNHKDVLVEIDKDLKKYSTMRLNAIGDLITVKSVEALSFVIKKLQENKVDYKTLGWGANILLPKISKKPFIQIDIDFDRSVFDKAQDQYKLPASVGLATLTSHANRFGLKGWEVFTGIPASLGGAIYMNAGTNLGEIAHIIKEVKLVDRNGQIKNVLIDKNSFSYRRNYFVDEGDVIVEATLVHHGVDELVSKKIKEYLEMRNRTQPLKEWTCGCIFKNHLDKFRDITCRAGHFIDIMGLKGLTLGNLRISPKHANFMENSGQSSASDVLDMIAVLKKEMKLQTGIEFETEVEF